METVGFHEVYFAWQQQGQVKLYVGPKALLTQLLEPPEGNGFLLIKYTIQWYHG